MKNFQEAFDEIHAYETPKVEFAKFTIWALSWIFGLFIPLLHSPDKRTLAGAFLIFALSFLMDFFARFGDCLYFPAQLIYLIFNLLLIALFLFSMIALFESFPTCVYWFFAFVAIVPVLFLLVDLCIRVMSKVCKSHKGHEQNQVNMSDLENDIKMRAYKYLTNYMRRGALGDIEEGDENHE